MFRRDIEGLRALAVGLVVLYHAHLLGVRGGFIGVDVFFVVSGFLITNLLVNEHNLSGRISIKNFYARRARRLLPASALVISLTAIASRLWLEPLRLRDVGVDGMASGGFIANIVFARRNTDYLQAGVPPSPLQHFWSLSVEEQFYLIWPTLLLMLMWRSHSRNSQRGNTHGLIGIGVISAVSFAVCVWQTGTSQPWAFFGLHTRAWELGAGALLALSWKYVEQLPRKSRAIIGWCGVIGIVFSAFALKETMAFPGILALLPVAGTIAVLMAGDDTEWAPSDVLRFGVLQWIGSRSYSIYLWHWPVLIIAEAHAGRALTTDERLGAILIALGGAELSYRLLENPVRRSPRLQSRPALALGLGLALIVVGVSAGALLRRSSPALAGNMVAEAPIAVITTSTAPPPDTNAPTTSAPDTGPTTTAAPETTTIPSGPPPDVVSPATPIDALNGAAATLEVPSNMEPSLSSAKGDKPEVYDNGCHVDMANTDPLLCEYGDTTSAFTVALYGDSHAAQWFPALQQVATDNGWRLLVITKMGCTSIDVITYNSLVGPTYPGCRPWREKAMQMMVDQKVNVVFVASSNRLQDPDTRQPFRDAIWAAGYDALVQQFKDRSIAPVLMTDTPYPGTDIPICLSKSVKKVTNCVKATAEALNAGRMQTVVDAAVRNGVQYLDVRNWVCDPDNCPVIVGNILVYRDSHHLTTNYVRFLTPLINEAVAPYVNGLRSRISTS